MNRRCIETRPTPEGWTRRRYICEDGTRVTTYEIAAPVLSRVGWEALEQAAAAVAALPAEEAAALPGRPPYRWTVHDSPASAMVAHPPSARTPVAAAAMTPPTDPCITPVRWMNASWIPHGLQPPTDP